MQEVSMAAWRQSILIRLQGSHACIEVRLRRRGAGKVSDGPWSATPSAYILGLQRAVDANGQMFYPKYVFGLHDPSASGSMLFGGLRGGPFTH